MKLICDVVRDLLPLYHDNVVGVESRKLVEAHLTECEECECLLEKLRDDVLDERIRRERNDVVGHHAQKVKHKGWILGFRIALAVPILVTFIVNLATAGRLDWFFAVLTAMGVVGSLTLVPLSVRENKGLWTLGSFVGTLLLMLFTIDTLYGETSWFLIPAIAIIFGVSIVFAPYILWKMPLKGFASRHKGFLAMMLNTVLLYILLTVIGVMVGHGDYWRIAFLTASISIIYPWLMFMTIRYLKISGLIIAGICLFYSGIFTVFLDSALNFIIDGIRFNPLQGANLFSWNLEIVNANVNLLVLLSCFVLGAIFIGAGVLRGKRN